MTVAAQPRLLRYALVGGLVAALYVALYSLLVAAGVARGASNALAFLLAVAVQYAGQAAFTFRRPVLHRPQAVRFAVMIGLGLALSAAVTGAVGPALGWPAWLAAAAVAVVLPVQNLLFMKLWVFAGPIRSGECK